MLEHVPPMELHFDGDCAQANGVNLPIVVINLPHRTDRWEAVSSRMAGVGLTKLIKAPAVLGAKLTDRQLSAVLGSSALAIDDAPRSHLTLTRPAIGCSLSHLAIWRWVIEQGLPRVLVLEDDANPVVGHDAALFRRVVPALPPEAGLVFLGRMIMGGLADKTQGSNLARLYYFNGTFAYLVTPQACRQLIGHVLPLTAHLDHQISSILIEQRATFPGHYTEPAFFEPDWSLRSDVYVPLEDDAKADKELGEIVERTRRALIAEGRPLLDY